ncbi:hypothetical protein HWV62_10717 [Athelia sp. TMB]|nr:hypothetical protein HWV62_10717 [Athelia sp. TMB]
MRQVNGDRQRRVQFWAKRLDEIASERRKLILQLEALDAQRKAAELEHNLLYNLDAPTSNFPNEVLSMIFETGAAQDLGENPTYVFGCIVSHVSHRWRSVALATPRLWTQIRLIGNPHDGSHYAPSMLPNDNDMPPPASSEKVCTYLSRSGVAPVDIHIKINYEDIADELLQTIADHIGHCRSLAVTGVRRVSLSKLLKIASQHRAPVLVSLSLCSFSSSFSDPLFPLGAPRLKNVALDRSNILALAPVCLPAFESVTQLRLSDLYFQNAEVYDSLRRMLIILHSLSYLELQFAGAITDSLQSLQLIELPTLQYLEVDCEGCPETLSHTMRIIRAPNLNCLSLVGFVDEHRPAWPLMLPDCHCPSLRHLMITEFATATFKDFDWLAKLYPNIEKLTFRLLGLEEGDGSEDLDWVLTAIVGPGPHERVRNGPGRGVRWPKLKSIAVSGLETTYHASDWQDNILKLKTAGVKKLSLPETFLASARYVAKMRGVAINFEEYREECLTPFARVV